MNSELSKKKPLRIMKFGGTSVGRASAIQKVVGIIRGASRDGDLVVVVSAMSEVTNQLIEAATQAQAGNRESVEMIFERLRGRHYAVVSALIHSVPVRSRINSEMERVFREGERLCQGTALLRELTLRARDSISSLGERLAAPLVAAALTECGVASEAIESTELIQTDSCHGCADPRMDVTGERCQARLRPLLQKGVVPVVTGFIGANAEGVLTTLGRGGSDYSATILGAALGADEVTIWTDVDGLMTADPRLVPVASTIPEISYREAAELAHFGAKVLHPKTLSAVTQCGIPLWIRNTFAPERPGTRITPTGPLTDGGVKGLTAISDVALISVSGPGIVGMPDVLGRTFATTAAVRANVLLISQSSSQNDICLVVSSAVAERTLEALRREFAQDLAHEKVEHITLDPTVAILTVVGKNMRGSATVGRTFTALGREKLNILAIAQGSSECNISVVVSKDDVRTALDTTHREFRLGVVDPPALPVKSADMNPAAWRSEAERRTANAD
ncbi:MAG TPA: aspartate kinase [Terriglobales bacterium]|nr:aspartate kinase [Terriglobales bacterium]